MKIDRRSIPLAAFMIAVMLSLSACRSSNPKPAASQTPLATPAQPETAPQGGTAGAGPAPASAASQTAAAPAPPPPPTVVELPSGTRIRVRLDTDLGSKISQPGDSFRATIADDVIAKGDVIIPRGARAEGTVVDAKPLGRFKGGARLEVRLERVHTKWGTYLVSTTSIDRAEKGKGKRSAGLIGGGVGFGGLAGGGKGAAIGAIAGGGAGTAGSAFTGNQQIALPAETLLTFRLERPVHITQGQ